MPFLGLVEMSVTVFVSATSTGNTSTSALIVLAFLMTGVMIPKQIF